MASGQDSLDRRAGNRTERLSTLREMNCNRGPGLGASGSRTRSNYIVSLRSTYKSQTSNSPHYPSWMVKKSSRLHIDLESQFSSINFCLYVRAPTP